MATSRAGVLAAGLAVDLSALRAAAIWGLLGAGLLGSWGVGWDIRWHLWVGRDSFWIAPHLLTYAAVAAGAALALGVLLVETAQARRGAPPPGAVRAAGLVGPPGFHLAWWGLVVTILAAPVDELWHRLFGVDVTIWSPPHLLGFAGAAAHGVGVLAAAAAQWPAGPARLAALWTGGALLLGHLQVVVDQALQPAFRYGGLAFFTYPVLAALLFPAALVLASRLAGHRATPVVLVAGTLGLQASVLVLADVGMALLRPEPAVEAAIARAPDSPLAIAHEMARRAGAPRPGRSLTLRWLPLAPAALMALVDPRRRPASAGLAFGLALGAAASAAFLRNPALAHAAPGVVDAALAAVLVTGAALLGGGAGARLADLVARRPR